MRVTGNNKNAVTSFIGEKEVYPIYKKRITLSVMIKIVTIIDSSINSMTKSKR